MPPVFLASSFADRPRVRPPARHHFTVNVKPPRQHITEAKSFKGEFLQWRLFIQVLQRRIPGTAKEKQIKLWNVDFLVDKIYLIVLSSGTFQHLPRARLPGIKRIWLFLRSQLNRGRALGYHDDSLHLPFVN